MTLFATLYALLQYCPDARRAEALNLGVIAFCPATGEIAFSQGAYKNRISKAFSSFSIDEEIVEQEIENIRSWINSKRSRISEEEFKHSLKSSLPQIVRFSPISVVRTADATATADELAFRLTSDPKVVYRSSFAERLLLFRQGVLGRLRGLAKEGRVIPRASVAIPGYGRSMHVDFRYRNGRDEWVSIQGFHGSTGKIRDEAAKLAYRGKSLFRKSHGNDRLVVICRFDDPEISHEVEGDLVDLFNEEECEGIPEAKVDMFLERVALEAKRIRDPETTDRLT